MKDGKVALITGGNRGIGLETARQLGKLGILPVIGARDLRNGREAVAKLLNEGIESETIQLDLLNKKDHQNAADYFDKKFGRLDILINNAGIMPEGEPMQAAQNPAPVSGLSEKIFRETMEANFFSVVALTTTLLPAIRKSKSGRIVNLASFLGSLTLQSDPRSAVYPVKTFAYNTSKTAINSFTVHLAYELKNTPIKVNSANPGWVKTQLGGGGATSSIEDGAKTSVILATLPDDGPTGTFVQMNDPLPW